MDQKVTDELPKEAHHSADEVTEGPGSILPAENPAPPPEVAAPARPAAPPPPPLDINQVQDFTSDQLDSLARKLDVRLFAARSRHNHIYELVRAALNRGGKVTIEGFLEQGESLAFLRSPRLNFLPVPEDVCVPRAMIQQFHLRPGQCVAGTVRLPRDREKSLSLD